MYRSFFVHFLLLTSLRATLRIPKLPTTVFISSTLSYIEGAHLIYFTYFGAPFVFTFFGEGHIEVVFKNATSRTFFFNVIFHPTSSDKKSLILHQPYL